MSIAIRRELVSYWQAMNLKNKQKNVVGRNKSYGFLHIGKNAGSTIGDFLVELTNQGYTPPMVLGHDWTLELAARRYPRMKISFILRDPLERTISGFNSRLRQGRPRNQNMWQDEEAIAFSLFSRVEDFLNACISDDEYLQSAARYAQNNIQHVKDGYVHHFGSINVLKKHIHRIHCVGTMEEIETFLEKLLTPHNICYRDISKTLPPKHESARKSSHYLASYSELEMARLRNFFGGEYTLYNELKSLASIKEVP